MHEQLKTQLAALDERIRFKDGQIEETKLSLEQTERSIDELRYEKQSEAAARATAEDKNSRIPELTESLKAKEVQLELPFKNSFEKVQTSIS